jgi:hypothetical protein
MRITNLGEINDFRRLLNIVPGNGMVLVSRTIIAIKVAKDCLAQMIEMGFSVRAANP